MIVLFALIAINSLFLPINGILFPIEYRLPLEGRVPDPGSPWPLPQKWIKSNETLTLDPKGFRFEANMVSCDVLINGMKRYRDIIFIDQRSVKSTTLPVLKSVYIDVHNINDCGYPEHNNNETYSIDISNNSVAKITSVTVWGALRALETFSQLVYQNDITKETLVNITSIHDFPRFSFRAMHMDTARHFIPKKVILANLDAMAYNKFNVFHWHIIDDQSFPFESHRFPELTKKGAYSPRHVYTQRDVLEIIEYSRMRGIRVIPEIDTPGHTHAMGKAFPELLTPCYGQKGKPYTPDYPHFSSMELINPLKNQSFSFIKELFQEFRNLFKDDFVHLGMDEVFYGCWESNPDISKFMKDNNMTKVSEVEDYYVKRTLENVKDLGYKTMLWQDPVDNGVKLANGSIVVIWKDKRLDKELDLWQNYATKIAKNGQQMVLSACWYLNYISTPYPDQDWEKFYLCDPGHFNGTEEEKKLVIGGEVCIWSEFVDATNILSRLWPRASSTAERLWSNSNDTQDVNTARHRLDQHRCRLLRRGIPAAPILNGYCGDYEWDMNNQEKLIDLGDRVRL
ncbi:beta-hexosaminidase subunit beta-like [Oppia nitens]|uniref:beta-hexosaminidase subunit beta-like n=1 Tax=Oppia nitens TaxID=1686743 RepID=UPI0023DC8CEA|nr:beta-hexosaminidase subunit beta-like [Oppia nitens]